jgi:hypothetical protein
MPSPAASAWSMSSRFDMGPFYTEWTRLVGIPYGGTRAMYGAADKIAEYDPVL